MRRKSEGYIRECHGDLHLRNLAWVSDAPVVFDCIEFNPDLRWIDVISDAAFLVMDLQDRRQPQLAQRFLNLYLEHTGDYCGLRVLPFYLTYRALVRAKVNAILAQAIRNQQKESGQSGKGFFRLPTACKALCQAGQTSIDHYPRHVGIGKKHTDPADSRTL